MSAKTFPTVFSAPQRRVVAELLPELEDRLMLDAVNARTVRLTAQELELVRDLAMAAHHHSHHGMKRNSLRHIVEAISKTLESASGIGSIPAAERLYQLKITLLDSTPAIWRRIQTRNCALDKLHERIQTAMGWTNSHLHRFKINGEVYGDSLLLDDGFTDFECVDSTVTKISEIVPHSGSRFAFRYEYDFGDSWQHEVLFEGCLRAEKGLRYPICVEGERACPPEDVGGVWGYAEFLGVLADPEHEDHDHFTQWAGPFNADEFNPKKATKKMQRGLPNWRRTQ
ncbi:plasmid pRiA4b ORF-3 family protein [Stieleria mannarensis]|uniref:plasmid pRiA4b ORF-3 family protein n=1 Tax=Stieleria mannarensis TaxID=2755585 RepID=UPI0016011911|nr:plasmid pRiA4b ORF-3 family protein [Rhodopirellula sp. JC639]